MLSTVMVIFESSGPLQIFVVKEIYNHVKISQLVNKMCSQKPKRPVESVSTSFNNAVILSSCYKVVTDNLTSFTPSFQR
jgi:hypothetical protein